MAKTKTLDELEAAESEHQDDPERSDLLRRARAFKTSWIELAEGLTRAKQGGRWRDWGYDSFEAYARTELRLRQETVEKLTGSYTFLKKRAPAVLERDPLRDPMPSYQSIDFLRRAEEREDAPRDTVAEIRKRVLEDAAPAAQLTRDYAETVFPLDEATRKARDVAGVRNVAKRLRELLGETRVVPRKLAGEVGESLDRLLAAIEEREEAAA